ncbi:4'-phosphopantetheinyl transferase superfamily protein [bacterium]|nr:4'-phosphopantetheinyl transferase superfamily protein [bacterium]
MTMVYYWRFLDADSTQLDTELARVLPTSEFDACDRYKTPELRRAARASRLFVRYILSQEQPDISPEDWVIDRDENGKPFVSGPKTFGFNISHTDRLLVGVVTEQGRVGIDIESVDRQMDYQKVAKRFFSSDEQSQLEAASASSFAETFFDIWTCKEAYLKATGLGLRVELDAMLIPEGSCHPIQIEDHIGTVCYLSEDSDMAHSIDQPIAMTPLDLPLR